jgi:hypothetical protein
MYTINSKVLKISNLAENVVVKSSDCSYLQANYCSVINNFIDNELFTFIDNPIYLITRIFDNSGTINLTLETDSFVSCWSSEFAGYSIERITTKGNGRLELKFKIDNDKFSNYVNEYQGIIAENVSKQLNK